MDSFGLKFNSLFLFLVLISLIVCIVASSSVNTQDASTKKPPSVGSNSGFDEIVVESSLNVRNKSPEKRQSKNTRLIIPHMIPKKFGEGSVPKYTHSTDDPFDRMSQSTKPSKSNKSHRLSSATYVTSTTTADYATTPESPPETF